MKSFDKIQGMAEKGDYTHVAKLVAKSASTVRMVVKGERKDLHNIQRVFSELLETREKIAAREAKRRARKNQRLIYE